MNEQMQKAQQELANISNEFTMFLANSGVLQVMLDAFKGLVGFVRTYVVPAFNFLATSVQVVWNFLTGNLMPVFTIFSTYIKEVAQTVMNFGKFVWEATAPIRRLAAIIFTAVVPAFTYVADFMSDVFRKVGDVVQDFLTPIFNAVGRVVSSVTDLFKNDFHGTIKDISDFMSSTFIQPFVDVANWIGSKLRPMFDPVIDVFNTVANKVNAWLAQWNSFQDIIDKVRLSFEGFKISLAKISLWIDETTDLWKTDEEKAEYERRRQEITTREQENLNAKQALEGKLQTQAAANLTAQHAEELRRQEEREARDAQIAFQRSQRDKNITDWQTNTARTIFEGTKNAATAMGQLAESTSTVSTNYNDSLALAKVEYARNNPGAAPSAEAARTAVSNQPAAGAGAGAGAASGGDQGNRPQGTATPPSKPQESAETLLSNLNTKMDQLIKVQLQANSIIERQLTVQQSMTGDLFVAP